MTQPPSRWFCKFLFSVVCIVSHVGHGDVALAQECDPLRPQDLQLIVIEAQDFLAQNAPGDSLETLTTGEANLPCLTGEVGPGELSSLYRVKASALYALGGSYRKQSSAVFLQAMALDVDASCAGGNMMRGATSQCTKAAARLRAQGKRSLSITGYHSGRALYLDGIRLQPNDEGSIDAMVFTGSHWLQIQTESGWDTVAVDVSESGSEYSLEPHLGSRAALAALSRGSLKLEGLPADASVVLDGRARRDIPLISQLEPGEHYVKISSPSMGTRGYTVVIVPGEETVFPVVFESKGRSGDGGSGVLSRLLEPKVAGSYGAAVLFAAGSGVSFSMASGRYEQADDAYETYLDMVEASTPGYEDQFEEASGLQKAGNRLLIGGWSAGALALASAGAGTYFFLFPDAMASSKQFLVLPVAFYDRDSSHLGLNLSGRF